MRSSSAIASPSSRMNAAVRYSGVAPPTARSLTVPWTASLPMSPPGKKSGRTTNESVVIGDPRRAGSVVARAEPTIAWSSSAASTSLPYAGRNSRCDQLALEEPAAAVAERDPVVRRNG